MKHRLSYNKSFGLYLRSAFNNNSSSHCRQKEGESSVPGQSCMFKFHHCKTFLAQSHTQISIDAATMTWHRAGGSWAGADAGIWPH